MGCIYNDLDGKCQLWDEDGKVGPNGCDECGNCVVDEDPDPNEGCDMYESNWKCHECDADFNLDEECTCE